MLFQWKWLRGDFDEPVEAKSFAALRIDLNGEAITRLYDRVTAAERDTVNVALYPLAVAIAENWWAWLYEPRKSDEGSASPETRHSLDSYMNGFVFPALSLWSGGDESIIVEHPNVHCEHYSLEFLPSTTAVNTLSRNEVEGNLFELVRAVAERIPATNESARLRDAWARVLDSLQDDD